METGIVKMLILFCCAAMIMFVQRENVGERGTYSVPLWKLSIYALLKGMPVEIKII
jgi:hypothetical protein